MGKVSFSMEDYDEEFLLNLGSQIGKVVRVDATTASASRGLDARMCVEVDLTQPLLSKSRLIQKIHKREYFI